MHMKLLDFIIYTIYKAFEVDGIPPGRVYTSEVYARNYFCLIFSTLGALWISTLSFKIESYRRQFFFAGPGIGAYLAVAQMGAIALYIIYLIKNHYTQQKIKEVSLNYKGFLTKRFAIILFIFVALIHLSMFLFSLAYFASTFVNKPLIIGI